MHGPQTQRGLASSYPPLRPLFPLPLLLLPLPPPQRPLPLPLMLPLMPPLLPPLLLPFRPSPISGSRWACPSPLLLSVSPLQTWNVEAHVQSVCRGGQPFGVDYDL